MSDIITQAEEVAEAWAGGIIGAADELVHDAEELFPPRPGGLVDRERKRKAGQEAAAEDAKNAAEQVQERAYRAVKVAVESPEVFAAYTYTIAAGGAAMILPASPYRYRAVVFLADSSPANCVVARDQGAAIGSNGFILWPASLLELHTRAQVWVGNPTGTAIQVSVAAESYAPPEK